MRKIEPYNMSGNLQIKGSKSVAQRMIFLSLFAPTRLELTGINWADDVLAAHAAIEQLGLKTSTAKQKLIIDPNPHWLEGDVELDVRESGLALRMMSMICAFRTGKTRISGKGTLLQRSLDDLFEYLDVLNVPYTKDAGGLPFTLHGGAKPACLLLDGTRTSQLLSGLMTVLPFQDESSTIDVLAPTSIPYLNLSLAILRDFGVELNESNWEHIAIPAPQIIDKRIVHVEGDWSAAANFIVAAAISGDLSLYGLNATSEQSDRAILDALIKAGGGFAWEGECLIVKKSPLQPLVFDATHCPDLFPPLVLLAAAAYGVSEIFGVHRLFNKECNRALALRQMFEKFGVKITYDEKRMLVHGTGRIKAAKVQSYGDHRMAMVAAAAASLSEGAIGIEDAEVVCKSYPSFYSDLAAVMHKR